MIESEELFFLSLEDLRLSFGITPKTIKDIVEEGIVTAIKDRQNALKFDSEAVRRIRTVLRLQRDLGINLAGAALALELIRKIEHLQALLDMKN